MGRRAACISAFVLASITPAIAHAQLLLEPPDERLEGPRQLEEGRLPNRKLIAAGAPAFLVPYVSSLVAAVAAHDESSPYLAIPIAGPWMTLGFRECPCQLEAFSGTLLVADGILQAAGLVSVARAFFVPEHEPVPVGITVDVGLNGIVTKGRF